MHKSQASLREELNNASKQVKANGLYYHYKNNDLQYKVLELAILEADDSICVIYEAQYGDGIVFVRPLKSWLDKAEWNGLTTNRFTEVKAQQD